MIIASNMYACQPFRNFLKDWKENFVFFLVLLKRYEVLHFAKKSLNFMFEISIFLHHKTEILSEIIPL